MTKEEMRVAIAEVCGWTHCDVTKGSCGGDVYEKDVWFMPGHPFPQTADWIADNGRINPPNYPEDLNAMAEAVRTLNVNLLCRWLDELDKICVPVHICPTTHADAVINATAEQRAEAFVRTVGRWVD